MLNPTLVSAVSQATHVSDIMWEQQTHVRSYLLFCEMINYVAQFTRTGYCCVHVFEPVELASVPGTKCLFLLSRVAPIVLAKAANYFPKQVDLIRKDT